MRALSLVILMASFIGCDGTDDDSAPDAAVERVEVACELGAVGSNGFEPFEDGATLELAIGFQGFLLIFPKVRADAALTGPVTVLSSLELADERPIGSTQPETRMQQSAEGLVSEDILLFLTPSDIGYFTGRQATLTTRLFNDTTTCIATAEVLLVDEDDCIHATDEVVCD